MGRLSRVEKAKLLQERLEKAVAEEKQLKVEMSACKDKIDALDTEIKDIMVQMGSEKQVAGNYIVFYHKKADSTRFDYKRYQTDHADLVGPYLVPVPGGMYFNIQ